MDVACVLGAPGTARIGIGTGTGGVSDTADGSSGCALPERAATASGSIINATIKAVALAKPWHVTDSIVR
jgi:hypothetical protein